MAVRLNKVTRDLNVGISTAVEFLKKKGFEVDENPNAKITDEQFDLLRQEFSTDKDLKVKSDQFILGRKEKDKDKVKPAVAIQGYEPAPEKPKQKFKPIGKIDLDKLNKPAKQAEVKPAEIKPAAAPEKVEVKVKEEVHQPVEEPVVKAKPAEPAPVEEKPVVEKSVVEQQVPAPEKKQVETPAQPAPVEEAAVPAKEEPAKDDKPENDGIFRLNTDVKVSKLNVVGLSDNKQEVKKKRNRIGKEKVDIKKAAREGDFKRKRDGEQSERNDGNNNKGKKNKDRFRKPMVKQEVSEEDVTKQVKETLARLTNKTKSKGAKYRKEKKLGDGREQDTEAHRVCDG